MADAVGLVTRVHRRLASAGHALPVRLWEGTRLGPQDAEFVVVLQQPWALRAMLVPASDLAIGEAYVHDDFDVEGSMVAALRAAADLASDMGRLRRLAVGADVLRLPRPPRRPTARRARVSGRLHSRGRDAQAVRFHYDLGNDFFQLYLDEEMVYSCAYFAEDDDDLDRAQVRKLDLVCRKLHLRPGERFLDIGCGWGALLVHAVRRYGVQAVGVTLSAEQAALARERVTAAGLDDRVEVHVTDYRDVTGTFDAIASIGMVEHVGVRNLPTYFATARRLLRPGGRFLNHGITPGQRNEARRLSEDRGSFVGAHVFPDGELVPTWMAVQHMQRAGFEVLDVEELRPHYARTLQHWVRRLEANADVACKAGGEEAYRVWRAYMAGSVVGFESRDLGVVQVLGSVGADVPPGRDWMLPTA